VDTKTSIKTRRSVKYYDSEYKMGDEEIKELFSLALLSPTAFNIQNWRFLIASNSKLREELRKVSWDQAQVTDSSLYVIICVDLKAWEKEPKRYWRDAPQEIQDFVIPAMDSYYRGKDQVQRDEAMRSAGIVAQTLMLAAKSMGYDSCPIDGFDFEEVAKLIKLPSDHVIALAVAIGKGTKEAWPRPGQLPLDEVLIHNSF